MLSGIDDPGESRMGEISMSGSTRERAAAVIGLRAFHSVLSSLLYCPFVVVFSGFRDQVSPLAIAQRFERLPEAAAFGFEFIRRFSVEREHIEVMGNCKPRADVAGEAGGFGAA